MSVSGRHAPLSPISVGGTEWSLSSKVPPTKEGGFNPSNRGDLASPPSSGGFVGNMSMNGFPLAPRSNAGPSPPPSIGRSSNGTNMYSARSEGNRNSTRTDIDESVLNEHYFALKAFLNARDANSRQQPNKARDKLLRLSSVQFHELSTDVFDELVRRQSAARSPQNGPNGPPNFLLPEKTFHPKRNQARQRLSSLGPPRFRDLAADVFHELERRFPHFVDGEPPRNGSASSTRGPGPMSRMGTPLNGNVYPPRGQSRMRRPSDASSARGPPPADAFGIPPSPGVANGDYGRPLQKQLNQNNTIIPNKSTMLEEDDDNGADDDGADVFGLERVTNEGKRNGSSGDVEADRKLIQNYQAQVRELQDKLDNAQDMMRKRQEEMNNALESERSRAAATNREKQDWADMRLNLENKLAEAQSLNKSMKQELERVRDDHDQETRQLQDELSALQSASRSARSANASPELQRENDELRESLRQQRQVTEEVRREAQEFLSEMRALSQQSGATYEKQAEMEKTIESLEREVREWRNRYARTKTQLRNMRASSLGLAMEHDAAKYVREQGYLDGSGLVKDVHVVKFQTAIDELLHTARKETPDKAIDAMKLVVFSVRRITRDVDESAVDDGELMQQQSRLKAKVSSTANGLITATKNFAGGAGISPVSLVDAAASHLTAAIVDLLRVAKIRSTPAGELEDDDDGTVTPVDSSLFSPRSTAQASSQDNLPPPAPFQGIGGLRASAESSAYSPVSSPRQSVDPYPTNGTKGLGNGPAYMGLNNGAGYGMQPRGGRADDFQVQAYGM